MQQQVTSLWYLVSRNSVPVRSKTAKSPQSKAKVPIDSVLSKGEYLKTDGSDWLLDDVSPAARPS